MLILIKHEAKKYAYDTKSGAAVPLSSLQYKVAENLEFPLAPVCPTALRYQLAKYDSNDVTRAYSFLYELYKKGLIGADDDTCIKLLLEGEYSFSSSVVAKIAITLAKERTLSPASVELLGNSPIKEEVSQFL